VKSVDLDQVSLDDCVAEAQWEQVVIMRGGKPVALMIGVEGVDEEQLHLGSSDRFWTAIRERRGERTMSRAELEQKICSEEHQQGRRASPPEE
jgi:antitoxin (DNA-binding transcriptional repressor) of toxin-antitoxin stability system